MRDISGLIRVSASAPIEPARPLLVNYAGVPAQAVFEDLARQTDLELTFEHGIIRLGQPTRTKASYATLTAGFEASAHLADVIRQADAGTPTIAGTRLIVTGTKAQVLKATEIVEAAQGGRDGWLIEVLVARITNELSRRIGISADVSGGATISLSANTSGPSRQNISAQLLAELLGELAETRTGAQILTRATLYVLEGGVGNLRQGDVVPVPRRTVSDQGTVTVTGFDMVQAGISLEVALRRIPAGRVVATLTPEISAVVGFVQDAPIVSTSKASAEIILNPGEWIVLSGLREESATTERTGLPWSSPPFGQRRTTRNADAEVVILARGVRVEKAI